jgi:CRP-like cAMP-binding protein
VNLLKFTNEDFDFNIKECAKILKYKQNEENQIIVEEGDKGDSFYLLLKGSVTFLVSRPNVYQMTKEEYMLHLFKLRKNNSMELLKQCLQFNLLVFPIEDNFDVLLKNLAHRKTKGGEFLDNENICNAGKELYNYIKNHDYSKDKKITIEEYINRNNVVLEDKSEGNNFLKEEKLYKKDKKTVTIPNFIVIGKCGTGECFGELALEQSGGKRKASVITNENTHFAIIYRNQYDTLLKNAIEKAKKKFFTVISCYNIFQQISNYALEKKYYKLFTFKKYEKGIDLILQNQLSETAIFIISGEFEVFTTRNIVEINDLIIYYKKFIRKHGSKLDYKLYNPLEEIRENEDLTLNKKFKTPAQNKILFEKRLIKLSIFQNRDILGLNDLMIPVSNSIGRGLVFCKSMSHDCQVYSIEKHQLFFIIDHEEAVSDLIIEYEINKMKMLIQRLKSHKERIYNFVKKSDMEIAEKSKKNYLNQMGSLRKNRFSNLEDNMILENFEIKNIMERFEKEKEMKEKIMESNSKKKNNINKIEPYDEKKKILPKINNYKLKKGNNTNNNSRMLSNFTNTSYNKFREGLFSRNLYETIFSSYAFTDINENEKSDFQENKTYRTSNLSKSNKNGIYDFLILEKFNSTYINAMKELKNS